MMMRRRCQKKLWSMRSVLRREYTKLIVYFAFNWTDFGCCCFRYLISFLSCFFVAAVFKVLSLFSLYITCTLYMEKECGYGERLSGIKINILCWSLYRIRCFDVVRGIVNIWLLPSTVRSIYVLCCVCSFFRGDKKK